MSHFIEAWKSSSYNLVIISNNDDHYEPHPIDLTDIALTKELIELREAIAENAHEVWAYNRKKEGWSYGPVRDDEKKTNPDLIPYNKLPESEKLYDREMAMETFCFMPVERSDIFVSEKRSIPKRSNNICLRSLRFCSFMP